MRKILLASTALVAMTSVSAMAADVTISGSYEALYSMVDDDGVTTDTDSLSSTSDIDFSFSSTTDSGIAMTFATGTSNGSFDDSTLTISSDMGVVRISDRDDDAVEGLDIDVDGYTAEEGRTTTPTYGGGFGGTGGASVSYTLPSLMDGLTVAVAMTDGTGDDKDVAYGVKYSGESSGVSFTLAAASSSTDNGTMETDQTHYGISVTSGAVTLGAAVNSQDITGSPTAALNTADFESSEMGISYKVSDSLTVGAYQRTAETGTASQKFEETAVGAVYTIASGLSASITSTQSDIDTTGDSRVVIGLNASF